MPHGGLLLVAARTAVVVAVVVTMLVAMAPGMACSCYNDYPLDGSVTNAKVITGEFTTIDTQQVFYGEDAKEVEV